ncbi:MAG: Fe-S cluster assembly protein SufD [Candidatus Margulisbacteria bacterium]|nr:Fe-S cluster assembly protein SufD [Candidatus Margulisiibacteriota bacterium]
MKKQLTKNEPQWLLTSRKNARLEMDKVGAPTTSDEEWRYINLDPILKGSFEDPAMEWGGFDIVKPYMEDKNFHTVVMVNGRFIEGQIESKAVHINSLSQLLVGDYPQFQEHWEKNVTDPHHFHLKNTAQFEDGVGVIVRQNQTAPLPIRILSIQQGKDGKPVVSQPRVMIILEEGACAKICKTDISVDRLSSFSNMVTECYVGKEADLEVVSIHEEGAKTTQFDTTTVNLEQKSRFVSHTYSESQDLARYDSHINFRGEDAYAELNGLSLLSGRSHVFHHTRVNHLVPNCESNQLFKHILNDHAEAEYNGLVYVEKGAQKTDSKQKNANLIFSDNAKVHSRPQLKIFADDVKCAHGSTTGQLDEGEVFYLKSRGLTDQASRALLTYGFAEDVIQRMGISSIRKTLESGLQRHLDALMESSE